MNKFDKLSSNNFVVLNKLKKAIYITLMNVIEDNDDLKMKKGLSTVKMLNDISSKIFEERMLEMIKDM